MAPHAATGFDHVKCLRDVAQTPEPIAEIRDEETVPRRTAAHAGPSRPMASAADPSLRGIRRGAAVQPQLLGPVVR